MKGIRPRFAPYAVALLAVSSALLLTLLLKPLLTPTIFLMFFAAIAVSAWYGGFKPGLVATGLSILGISYFFLEPAFSLHIADLDGKVRLGLFLLVATLINWLHTEVRTSKQRLEVAMQQLKASEARFKRLAEANIIGVIVADINGAIVEANDAFLTMVGYTQEELLGGRVNWRQMTAPEYLEMSDRAIVELQTTGVCQHLDLEYLRKDGSRVPVLLGLTLLEPNQEQVIGFVLDMSQRVLAEKALKDSEKRFRRLAESNIVGVIFGNLNGDIHYANDYFLKMVGYTLAELSSGKMCWQAMTPPEYTDLDNYAINELLKHGVATPFEKEYIRKDGSRVPVIVGVALLPEPFHSQQEFVAFCLELSEQKRVEAALRQREDELRLITNAVPVLISYVDAEQRFRFNNQRYEEWFGLTAAQTYGKHIQEILSESVYQSISPYLEAVFLGEQVTFEVSLPHQDGTNHIANTTYVPQFDENNKVKGFVALITDITQQKLAEKALKDSEERLRTLTEKVRVIPWELDATNGNFTYVGPQSVEILGYPATDWYSDNFWKEHIHPEDREWAVQYCQESSLTLDNYEFEYRMLAADGKVVWLYDIVNVVRDGKKPRLLHGFLIDISEQQAALRELKQAEQEREELLEREQAARTAAESANRLKDEFLATLSHELRTPLNTMVGWTQLLTRRRLDETTTAQALETINRNTNSLAQLIKDILDMSQIIRGKLRLNIQPVELIPIVEAAIDTVRPAADAKEICLEWQFDPTVGVVMGDANRLQQLVWNLLGNAVKFTPIGGSVSLQLNRLDSYIEIRVSDTGVGIAPEFLPHVFERFRQADSSTTRSHGGLGLGLAIVRHLVELHGGTVYANSSGIGQGTTFTVNLPMKALAHTEWQSAIVTSGGSRE